MKRRFSLLITTVFALSLLSGCGNGGDFENTSTNTRENASESISENISEVVSETVSESVPESVSESVPESVSETVSERTAETSTVNTTENAPSVPAATTSTSATTANPPQGTTSNINNTPTSTTTAGADSSPQNTAITAEFKAINTWPDGGKTVVQFDGVVKNTGNTAVSSWSVTVSVPSDAVMVGSWNGFYSINGTTLTIKNENYNGEIPAGKSVDIGFQIKSAKAVSLGDGSGTGNAAVGNANPGNQGNTGQNGTVGNNNPAIVAAKDVPAPTSTDWLSVSGNKIVNKDGKAVWITGINWFGYNTGTNTFDGLWAADFNTSIAEIANRGFNMLRIPISTELLKQWSNGIYPEANYNRAYNSYLNDMNSLEIFDYVIGQCRANGIKIMIDIHSAKTDPMGHMQNMWYHADITEKDFIDTLAWIARRYAHDDTILAYDLKNEPHGKPNESPRAKWDNSTDPDNWKYVAEKAALAVLNANPNALVLVEGIEIYPKNMATNPNFTSTNSGDYYFNWWGGNLRGVRDNPVNLGRFQNKLVYSPHDYGPTVHQQPWFQGGYTFESLMKDCWRDNWFFIHEENIAPLLIGEWGGFMREPNLQWMTYLRQLIKENKLHHTFWCWNANSGDTGGLVLHDFTTWDEEKYAFVKEVLWQQDGKFVGLDRVIPLGNNGIPLSQAR
ncbi:MAG: cellulase family glycosylhydrolase [Oscillospiraceae bacterium]|nr:cellulase family glycosylhydrolase [Oscillospiraceae bacterium]